MTLQRSSAGKKGCRGDFAHLGAYHLLLQNKSLARSILAHASLARPQNDFINNINDHIVVVFAMNRSASLFRGVNSLVNKIQKNGSFSRSPSMFRTIGRKIIAYSVDEINTTRVATILTRQKQIDLIIREGLKRNPPAKQGALN